ncbi:SDR family oxidoreductase [Candidatus Poribacteria bacterium]|nr:SDR family oxidoreductase [Candidatus Poribacteria bacterium]
MDMFRDRIAIITGAASGIGRAISEELARRGATVVLSDVNAGLLEETTNSIAKAGHRAKAATVNVTDHEAVKNLVDDTVKEYGRLDYIFNNAGITVVGETQDFSCEDWRKVIEVNLFGVINGVLASYPVMVKQGFGHIVNTASLAGLIPAGGEISYTTSKYGIVGLSHALRVEGADLGVKVSVICPGFINTPIIYNSKTIGLDHQKMIAAIPGLLPVDECAREILHGVECNKATILITRLAKVLWPLHRISPNFIIWLGKRFMRDIRKMRLEK